VVVKRHTTKHDADTALIAFRVMNLLGFRVDTFSGASILRSLNTSFEITD
jgi:hypothetical protein